MSWKPNPNEIHMSLCSILKNREGVFASRKQFDFLTHTIPRYNKFATRIEWDKFQDRFSETGIEFDPVHEFCLLNDYKFDEKDSTSMFIIDSINMRILERHTINEDNEITSSSKPLADDGNQADPDPDNIPPNDVIDPFDIEIEEDDMPF